eukprot:COSAG02_NODE_1360_length_13055_cov_9.008567_9_plen_47_part_00
MNFPTRKNRAESDRVKMPTTAVNFEEDAHEKEADGRHGYGIKRKVE